MKQFKTLALVAISAISLFCFTTSFALAKDHQHGSKSAATQQEVEAAARQKFDKDWGTFKDTTDLNPFLKKFSAFKAVGDKSTMYLLQLPSDHSGVIAVRVLDSSGKIYMRDKIYINPPGNVGTPNDTLVSVVIGHVKPELAKGTIVIRMIDPDKNTKASITLKLANITRTETVHGGGF